MARRSFAGSRKCSRPAWTVTSSSASRSWNTSASDADTWKRGGFEPRSRSEEHTSELQSLMRISYAVCGLKKKNYALMLIYKQNSAKVNEGQSVEEVMKGTLR